MNLKISLTKCFTCLSRRLKKARCSKNPPSPKITSSITTKDRHNGGFVYSVYFHSGLWDRIVGTRGIMLLGVGRDKVSPTPTPPSCIWLTLQRTSPQDNWRTDFRQALELTCYFPKPRVTIMFYVSPTMFYNAPWKTE